MNDSLDLLQERLGHRFRDPELLLRALTHPSYVFEHPEAAHSNQRLEFLGDAVLQLILTERLFLLFPDDREGPLSTRRAAFTKGAFLSRLARETGLNACLRLSASEEANGGRDRDSTLEDAFEALVAAVYLDSDLPATRRIVLALYGDLQKHLDQIGQQQNPKGRLQELVQPVHGNTTLRYETEETAGEDHAREFTVAVFLHDHRLGSGRGSSKKTAEENAARAALKAVEENPGLLG